MVGLPRSIIKKYGVTKKAWQVFRGSSDSRPKRPRRKGVNMARRKYGRRSGGGGGGGGIGSLTPLLYGAGAAFIAPKLGLAISPLIAGAAGGFFARKNVMGAVMGAAGAYGASMFLNGGSSSGWGN